MSTPDISILLTTFLLQANPRSRQKKGPDRKKARCIADQLKIQQVIALMNQHHRQSFALICNTETSTSFRIVSHKGMFPFVMMFDGSSLLVTLKHVAFTVSSGKSRTSWHIDAHCISLDLYTVKSGWHTFDTPDGSRKRQRLDDDADTHVKKLRAWANEWPVEGRVKGTLEGRWWLPWRIGEDGNLKFGGPGPCQTNKRVVRCPKTVLFTETLLWNTAIWAVAHETWGLLRRFHVGLGNTFSYKDQDREIVLSCLASSFFKAIKTRTKKSWTIPMH